MPIELDMDGREESIFIPTSKETAADVKEGDVITVTIKGKVMGAVAREGDATEFDSPGTVRIAVSEVEVEGRGEMEDFIDSVAK